MTEMEARQAEMDGLLRRSMAAPVPSLPEDFDQRLTRKLHQDSRGPDRFRRLLITGYSVVSAVTCAVVMRSQGLDLGLTAVMILGPLAVVAATPWVRRAARTTIQHNAR